MKTGASVLERLDESAPSITARTDETRDRTTRRPIRYRIQIDASFSCRRCRARVCYENSKRFFRRSQEIIRFWRLFNRELMRRKRERVDTTHSHHIEHGFEIALL